MNPVLKSVMLAVGLLVSVPAAAHVWCVCTASDLQAKLTPVGCFRLSISKAIRARSGDSSISVPASMATCRWTTDSSLDSANDGFLPPRIIE